VDRLIGFGVQFEHIGDQIGAQLEALNEQFSIMGVANQRRHQSNPHYEEVDDEFSVEEA
jgi:hypothetical protein